MPEHEIKTRVSVDGEQGYRQAIKSARDQLKLLEAQLKQATSAMGRNASEQDKAAKKADTLRLKIEQQKKIIEQTQKALMQASQKYGQNSAAAVQWQTRLANAQTVLNNMNNELDGLTNGLRESGDAFREAGESAGESAQQTANFADGIKGLTNVAKGVGNDIKGVFDQTLRNVRWVTDEVVSMINVATGQVDQWKGITDVYGGSAEGVQKWLYGTSAAGLKYSDTTGPLSHLVQAVDSDAADAEDALKKLNVVESKYDNHWDFFIGTLEALNAYQGDDKGALVTALFGKGNYASVMTMMTKWDSMMNATQNAEEHNLFLGGDEIEQVDAFQEKVNLLLETVTNLQTLLGKDFIINFGLNDLVEHATDTIVSLANLFSAIGSGDEEAAKQATIELTANLQLLSTDLTNAINSLTAWVNNLGQSLKESDDPILQTIGRILESLSGTLNQVMEWLEDPANQQLVADIVQWMLINKAAEVVSGKSVTDWVSDIFNVLGDILAAVLLIKSSKIFGDSGTGGALAFGTLIPKFFSSVASIATQNPMVPNAAAFYLSDLLPQIFPREYFYGDESKKSVSTLTPEEWGAIHAFQAFIGKEGDLNWFGKLEDQLPEWFTSPYGRKLFMDSEAEPTAYTTLEDGTKLLNENNRTRAYVHSLLSSGQGVDGFEGWVAGKSDERSTDTFGRAVYGGRYSHAYADFSVEQLTNALHAGESTFDSPYAWWLNDNGYYDMLLDWGKYRDDYTTNMKLTQGVPGYDGDYVEVNREYGDLGPGGYAPWVPPGAGSGQVDLTDAAANKIAAAVAHMPIDMDGQRVANLVSQHMAANV